MLFGGVALDKHKGTSWMNKYSARRSWFSVILITMLVGCQGIPKDALKPSQTQLQSRQQQTQVFHTNDETKILAASAGVLQDMGYTLENSETKLGVITASKKADAVNKPEFALRTAAAILGAFSGQVSSNPYKGMAKDQKIRVSLVSNKLPKRKATAIRVTFQRIVWDAEGNVKTRETIGTPDIYQQFFAKLSKSIFLEAHSI